MVAVPCSTYCLSRSWISSAAALFFPMKKSGSGSVMAYVAKGIMDAFFDVGEAGELDTYENTMS